ncbi:hypothetical protein JOC95_004298 [Bacillus tianshenii]|uniref:Transmembrane protein n=1 Tax=Sutcliffiella tianshenii TaxID=1463404 RepID=A0ABS2P5Y3_9BACI|nr:hypothetical protein [Bacillus tianshenii]
MTVRKGANRTAIEVDDGKKEELAFFVFFLVCSIFRFASLGMVLISARPLFFVWRRKRLVSGWRGQALVLLWELFFGSHHWIGVVRGWYLSVPGPSFLFGGEIGWLVDGGARHWCCCGSCVLVRIIGVA